MEKDRNMEFIIQRCLDALREDVAVLEFLNGTPRTPARATEEGIGKTMQVNLMVIGRHLDVLSPADIARWEELKGRAGKLAR
jgi:hypothetical protein